MPKRGDSIAGYTIRSKIEDGRHGSVYRAENAQGRVAIKFPNAFEDFEELLDLEGRVLARLEHPHIIRLIGGFKPGQGYLILEYASSSLAKHYPLGQLSPIEEIIGYLIQTASGLQYAHGQGVLHQDIKPENILLTERGAVLADFSVAKCQESASVLRFPVIGSYAYVSYEQFNGYSSPQSDIYSLGATSYRLLCGLPPRLIRNEEEFLVAHEKEPLPLRSRRSEIPASIEQAVMRALSRNPEDRFPSAKEFAEALISSVE